MRILNLTLSILAGVAITASCLGSFAAENEKPSRILMLTQSQGYMHSSVKRPDGDKKEDGATKLAVAEVAMIQLGQTTGLFTVDCTQDAAADFTQENLQNYDAVMFYTTGALPIADADRDYFFKEWLTTKGHGFIGFHSAADTYGDYQPYWDMVGGTFDGHPWGAGTTVTINVHEPANPMMKPFGKEFTIKDEIYQYKNWQPEKVRVLMSLDMTRCRPSEPRHVPVAWVKSYGEGKVYFNNLGHNESTWRDQRFLDSITAGVKWIRGDIEGESAPNPELSQAQAEAAKAAAAVANAAQK
ncbi:MAG: ThuA domain-containing protein [Planctomycetota bacterium]|nr:ThuA domain-containing protein [Planctomycetota bacterium]